MYRVERTEKYVVVLDERSAEVWKGFLDGYIIFGEPPEAVHIRDLDDGKLLAALASAVRLPVAGAIVRL